MSTRKTFAYELIGKVRKVWGKDAVEEFSEGYKIITPDDGTRVQIHLSPSDRNHSKTVMRILTNHGWQEDEKKYDELQKASARMRTEELQRKAHEDIEKAQSRANSYTVERAAGPYSPPPVDESTFLVPHPSPLTFNRVLITPELAAKLLVLNTDNRGVHRNEVEYWERVIRSGHWRYTHQGVALDTRPVLQDGQKRLTAIVNTGIACEMQVSVGMPVENFDVIDTGRNRSYADVLRHKMPSIRGMASIGPISRVILLYDDPTRDWNDKVTNEEVVDFAINEGHAETLLEALRIGQKMHSNTNIVTNGAAAGVFLLWREVGRTEQVADFIEKLTTGLDLDSTLDPRYALRRYTSSKKTTLRRTAVNHLAIFIKTWNLFVAGKGAEFITWRANESMPKVQVV